MSISAVLLAGGESRRMGRDKATLNWRGRPLWQWQLQKLRALKPEEIFVSLRGDVPWREVDVDLILDVPPSQGPLSGLAVAMASIETNHLVVLAVDMPFVTIGHLRYMCGLLTDGKGVIPMVDGKAEPLCAIYPKRALPVFTEALQGNNYSLQPIVRKLIKRDVLIEMRVSDLARVFYRNINEPQDVI